MKRQLWYDFLYGDKSTMKIDMNEERIAKNGNLTGDKELVHRVMVIGFADGEFADLIDARWWMGRSRNASEVHCTVWISDVEVGSPYSRKMVSGKGRAGGYGYCKQSAALDDALRNAGVTDFESVHGVGMAAVESALVELAGLMDNGKWAKQHLKLIS